MDKRVIITGCTKNSASYIQDRIIKLHEIGKYFKEYSILLYENDSTDNTVDILNNNKNNCFNFISEQNIIERIKHKHLHNRVQILCYARNQLLHHVKLNFAHYDLLIMIDLDNVLENFNPKTILNAFKYGDNWAGLTANCIGKYYDIWALRIDYRIWNDGIHGKIWKEPIVHDCWSQIKNDIAPRRMIQEYQKIIPVTMPLIQTNSSFGGLGIYKINAIMNATYETYNGQFCQCEHVVFNKSIKGPLFICPKLLLKCPEEHIIL
jgi:hypothetical protein